MKTWLILVTFSVVTFLSPALAIAQSNTESGNHTAREEQEGKEIWQKLQAKQLECQNLTDDNFTSLGEYFMGQMTGNSHEAMNTMMEQMMGKEGEEQMHVIMGKRLSGCEPNAQIPSTGSPQGGGGGNPMMGPWFGMMNGWSGFGLLGWFFMIIFWLLIILGVVALIRYLGSAGRSNDKEKAPLEILKERYARGEIDKKEFEEKKKDL